MKTQQMPQTFIIIGLMVATTILLTACGINAGPLPGPDPEERPPPAPQGMTLVDEQTWRDVLRFSLWVSAEAVGPNEVLEVSAEVENLTDQATPFGISSRVCKGGTPIETTLSTPFEHSAVPKNIRPPNVAYNTDREWDSCQGTELDPGQVLKKDITWDAAMRVGGGNRLAVPNGVYDLGASFRAGGPGDSEWLRLSHDIRVTGSYELLPEEETLEAARDVPKVNEWLDEHQGDAIAKEEGGNEYRVRKGDDWESESRREYEEARAYEPNMDVDMTLEGLWVYLSMGRYGPSPRSVCVMLDRETGEPLDPGRDFAETDRCTIL